MEWIISFLSQDSFRFLWLPLLTTVITIGIKHFWKIRGQKFSVQDLIIAPNLVITAIFIILIKTSLLATGSKLSNEIVNKIMTDLFVFALLLGGTIIMAWIIRENGWEKNNTQQIIMKKSSIFFSDLVGLAYLLIAFNL